VEVVLAHMSWFCDCCVREI